MNPITIHTDGSCETQTRLGGWAAVLSCGGHQRTLQGSATNTTVNAMELTAAVEALKALKQPGSQVQLFSDSNYVVRGANEWLADWVSGGWKNARGEQVANLGLWQELKTLLDRHHVTLTWIPRNQNTSADELAQSARLAQQSQDDAGSLAAPTVPVQAVSETHILIAGSRYATREMLTYTKRVVQRAHQLGWTILVGDNPRGVDRAVVEACRALKAKVIVAGIANFPRNGGCKHGQYMKIERDLYLGTGGRYLNGYTVRDRWMVDMAQHAVFVWNGQSSGTFVGYEYAQERRITAHLKTFSGRVRHG